MTTPPGAQPPEGANPYQQPGFSQGNPYQQTTQPMAAAGPVSLDKPGDQRRGGRWKMPAAIAFSVLLVGGVTAGGIMTVLDSDSDSADTAAPTDDEPDGDDAPEDDDASDDDGDDDADDPRGSVRDQESVVADDWQVQSHRERFVEYDVPGDWTLESQGVLVGWEVEIDDEEEPATFLVGVPTYYEAEFCGADSWRAMTGVTGAVGAVSTAEAAEQHALNYAYAVYDNDVAGDVTEHGAEEFSTEYGLEGHIAVADIAGYPYEEDDECATPSATVISVGYTDPNGDIMTWLMMVDREVDEELDQETIDLITGSLRPLGAGDE